MMNENGIGKKVLDWITLVLALVFIGMGIGLVTGVFFPEKVFLEGTMRYVLGFVLIGYGIIRAFMVRAKLKRGKREKWSAEKT